MRNESDPRTNKSCKPQSVFFVSRSNSFPMDPETRGSKGNTLAPKYNVPPFSWSSHFCLLTGLKNTNLVEEVEILLPIKFLWFLFSGFRGAVENVPANQRLGPPSCFSHLPEKKNLVEDVEILLPVKFCWILFSSFRGEVKNVSANQRPGLPFCFSDRHEKHKHGRGHWDLAYCQVLWNSVERFQRSQKCLSQSEARAAIMFIT